ncbi:hypothetical protein VDGD_05841 [Verticillium dahliae]|nr:hypothetical protein VDGD_05841 [Verticillium dahliae]
MFLSHASPFLLLSLFFRFFFSFLSTSPLRSLVTYVFLTPRKPDHGSQSSEPHPSDKIGNALDDIAQTRASNRRNYAKLEALNRESEEAKKQQARRQDKITSLLVKLQPSEAHCARQKDLIRRLKPQADEAAGYVWWPTNYERARCYEEIMIEPAVVEEAGLPALPLAPAPAARLLGGFE